MDKLEIIYQSVDDLIPYDNNPRDNERAIVKVAESIDEFGFKNPIIIDEDNIIVAGHTRLLASKKLGLKEVPTIRVADLDQNQLNAFRIVDNKTGEFAKWDFEKLEQELDNIDMDMERFGLIDEEYDFDIDEFFDEQEVGSKQPKIITCPSCQHEFEAD